MSKYKIVKLPEELLDIEIWKKTCDFQLIPNLDKTGDLLKRYNNFAEWKLDFSISTEKDFLELAFPLYKLKIDGTSVFVPAYCCEAVETGPMKCICPRFDVVNFGCKCGGV